MNHPRIQAKRKGLRFWIEVPPVEWILEHDCWRVGKLPDGSLLVVEDMADSDGSVGWVANTHESFQAIVDKGLYDNDLWLALAPKLGIEKMEWNGIWLDVEDWLSEPPATKEELAALHQRRAGQLEAAGKIQEAADYRRSVGLPAKKPRLALVDN